MILVLGYVRQNSYSQKMLAAVLRVDVHESTTIKWFRTKSVCEEGGEDMRKREEEGGGEAVRANGADVDHGEVG